MNITELNRRVTFQKYTQQESDTGELTRVLQDYKTVWAAVKTVYGIEYEEAKKLREELTYRITTRYFSDINDEMLIKFRDKTFEILDILNVDSTDNQLILMCKEKVDTRANRIKSIWK